MSDMVCRKSMMRCQTPGMCSPHGGCRDEVTTAKDRQISALIAENERLKNSKPQITQDMVDEFRQGQSQGESLNTSLLRVLRACPGRGAADYWKAEHLAGNSRLHEVAVACATAEQERDQLKAENEALRKIISDSATSCGAAVSVECSLDFMAHLPVEIFSVISKLRNALAECSDSLHAEMLQKFGGQRPDDMHPVTRREYDRDMAEIACYRAVLSKEAQS